MPRLFFLCHPIRPVENETIEQNLQKGKEILAELNRLGISTIAPWIGLCESLNDFDPLDRKTGIKVCNEAIRRCSGIILAGDRISSGMVDEILLAEDLNIKIINVVAPHDLLIKVLKGSCMFEDHEIKQLEKIVKLRRAGYHLQKEKQ